MQCLKTEAADIKSQCIFLSGILIGGIIIMFLFSNVWYTDNNTPEFITNDDSQLTSDMVENAMQKKIDDNFGAILSQFKDYQGLQLKGSNAGIDKGNDNGAKTMTNLGSNNNIKTIEQTKVSMIDGFDSIKGYSNKADYYIRGMILIVRTYVIN